MKSLSLALVFSLLAISSGQHSFSYQNPAGVTFIGFGSPSQQGNIQQFQARAQPQPQQAEQPQQPQEQEAQQPQLRAQSELPQPGQGYEQQDQQAFEQQQQQLNDEAQQIDAQAQQQQPQAVEQPQQPGAIQYAAQPLLHHHQHPGLQYHQTVLPAVHHAHHAYAPVLHHQKHYPQYAAYSYPYHQQVVAPVAVPAVANIPVTKLAYSHGVTQKLVDVAHPAISTRRVKVKRPALRKEFYDIEHRVIIRPAGSATLELSQPISKEQQGPAVISATKLAHVAPVIRYGKGRRILDGGNAQFAFARLRSGAPEGAAPQPQPQTNAAPAPRAGPPQPEARNLADADTQVIEGAPEQQAQPQQPQQDQPQPPQAQPQQQQQAAPAPAFPQPRELPQITPDMPAELQNRLIQLLTARGGTVTEILDENGNPADSASVLQVSEALGDPALQGGERITTRRIVVTRPIETIQEVEIQEPATKLHRVAVNKPTLFQHHIPAVKQVPVAAPLLKAQPAYFQHYAHHPQAHYAYHH